MVKFFVFDVADPVRSSTQTHKSPKHWTGSNDPSYWQRVVKNGNLCSTKSFNLLFILEQPQCISRSTFFWWRPSPKILSPRSLAQKQFWPGTQIKGPKTPSPSHDGRCCRCPINPRPKSSSNFRLIWKHLLVRNIGSQVGCWLPLFTTQ